VAQQQFILMKDRNRAEARFGYALALAAVGRFADARDQLRQGQQLHPDRPEFSEMLARRSRLVLRRPGRLGDPDASESISCFFTINNPLL
jgi:predicted Zn-dependent protease